MLALELLGPVVLRRAGQVLPVAIKKTQALLVLLALQPRGRALPRGRAVALLWPQLDESTGRRNLRRELARLREIGAGEAVLAQGDLLLLDAQVQCDLLQFQADCDAGQPDSAIERWRGPPADGLALDDAQAFNEWWAPERERLLGLRRRALVASASAHEARGDLATALQRIHSLLADDPLQEQHHRDAMRLLAASGRREAALAQFARCTALLRGELGLEPMAETLALAAMLRSTDAASGAAPAPAVAADGPPDSQHSSLPARPPEAAVLLLPAQLPFVGRESEVAALELAWRAGRCVLIVAEGGLGKTRLATDFAAAHGPYALVRTRPSDSAVPYAAFTRALRALAGPAPDLAALPRWAQQELARLLPEWGEPPPPLQSAAERNRFFEACAMAWLVWTAESFDAVILDDWHHADAASGDLLAFIAQRRHENAQPGARELVLYRPELAAPASASLRRLQDSSDALQLRLAPLADDAVLTLLQTLSGVAKPLRFAARLQQATRGNPFFLAETLRHLAERRLLSGGPDGVWHTPYDSDTQDYRELPVPRSVHEAVLDRVQRLGPAAQRVLEAACLAAEPFAPGLLAPACALSELDTVLAIEQAVDASLLREHEAGGFAFAHDLVQQALDGTLAAERRRLVHRRLALGAEAAGASPALIAAHHEASGDASRAVVHRMAAGDQAWARFAWAEAIGHWQQALANGATVAQAAALHRQLMRVGHLCERQDLSLEHAGLLQALLAGPELSALQSADDRVLMLTDVARYLAYSEKQPEALALLNTLPAATSDLQRARVLAVRAEVCKELGHVDEAVAAARAALALQAMQGRERTDLLSTLSLTLHQAGRLPEAVQGLRECADLSAELRDDVGAVRARYQLGTFLGELGDAGAEAELLRAASMAERVGALTMQRAVLYSLCCLYANQTRPAQVLQAATRGWQMQPPLPAGGLRVMYRLAFVDAHHALGDLGEAWQHAAAALAEAGTLNEVYVQVSSLSTSLELVTLLGEQACAGPLRQSLGPDLLRQMPEHANDLWLALAKSALLQHDTAAAAQALAQVTGDIGIGRVAVFNRLVGAELALVRGQVQAALALLPAPQAEGMSDESRLRALALRVRACTQAHAALASAMDATLLAECTAALHSEPVHATAALYLHAALAAAAAQGVAGVPATAAADAAAHLARLCESLHAHPAQERALRHLAASLGGAVGAVPAA
jgi:DNA-binding SARP family transcriptional activator